MALTEEQKAEFLSLNAAWEEITGFKLSPATDPLGYFPFAESKVSVVQDAMSAMANAKILREIMEKAETMDDRKFISLTGFGRTALLGDQMMRNLKAADWLK